MLVIKYRLGYRVIYVVEDKFFAFLNTIECSNLREEINESVVSSILLATCIYSVLVTFCHVFSDLKRWHFIACIIINAVVLNENFLTKEDRISVLGVINVDGFNHGRHS